MRLKATFRVPKVNLSRFRQALHETLSESLTQAAMVWINSTADSVIPTWSAASRATFSPLASHVGYVMSLTPVSDAPNRVALGLANGTATFETNTISGLYYFTYVTTLPHLIINESYNANGFPPKNGRSFHLTNPGPYHFQEKGQKAFREFASTVVLPGWGAILDVSELRIG